MTSFNLPDRSDYTVGDQIRSDLYGNQLDQIRLTMQSDRI